MKILLTGAGGFIGAAFARLALLRGHQIAGLTRSAPSPVRGENLVWIRGSLEAPPWEEIKAFAPEVCVHSAWITAPGVYLGSPENDRLLEASSAFLPRVAGLGAKRVVSLGTCIEYRIGNEPKPLSEATTPLEPATTYARCKNELRLRLEKAAAVEGFGFCWGRVFYPYGPGEHPARLCSSIIKKLSGGEKIVLKTPDSTKDYIFIDDLAAAVLTVVESEFTGAINLGTGIGVTIRQIAQTLGRLMARSELITEATPPQIDPFGYVVANASRLHSLRWEPKYHLAAGLERILGSVRSKAGPREY
jgi:nucleoside-diphosphate-sugar epimerase